MKVEKPKARKNVNPKVKPSDGDWNAAKNKRKVVQQQKSKQPKKVKAATPKVAKSFVKPKQVWKSKAAATPCLNKNKDMCLREMSYIDASGVPRNAMAWVPVFN